MCVVQCYWFLTNICAVNACKKGSTEGWKLAFMEGDVLCTCTADYRPFE